MTFRYLAVSVFVLWFPAAWAQTNSLCDELAQLQKAQPQFADLRGAPMSGEKWQSRMASVGGVGNCSISALADGVTSMKCETTRYDTEEAARAKSSSLLDSLGKCLGPNWSMHRTDLGKTFEDYSFLNLDAPVSFSVSVVHMNLEKTTWTVWMSARMKEKTQVLPSSKADTRRVEQPLDPWPQDTKLFCEDLQKVIVAAKDGFESIKGRSAGDKSWKTQLVLDATNRCDISAYTNRVTYSCEAGRHSDRVVMTAKRDAVVASVRGCVDRSWQASRRLSSSGVEVTEFESSLLPMGIQVRLRNALGEYRLSIDVDKE